MALIHPLRLDNAFKMVLFNGSSAYFLVEVNAYRMTTTSTTTKLVYLDIKGSGNALNWTFWALREIAQDLAALVFFLLIRLQ